MLSVSNPNSSIIEQHMTQMRIQQQQHQQSQKNNKPKRKRKATHENVYKDNVQQQRHEQLVVFNNNNNNDKSQALTVQSDTTVVANIPSDEQVLGSVAFDELMKIKQEQKEQLILQQQQQAREISRNKQFKLLSSAKPGDAEHECSPTCTWTYDNDLDYYMCEQSGNTHACGEERCHFKVNCGDVITCELLGLVIAERLISEDPSYQDTNMVDGRVQAPTHYKIMKKRQDKIVAREGLLFNQAVTVIEHLLFSEHRRQIDIKKFDNAHDLAMQEISSYIRYCKNINTPVISMDINVIYLNKIKLYCSQVYIRKRDPDNDKARAQEYAVKCVKFWKRLVPDYGTKISIKDFFQYVILFLYKLYEGYQVQGQYLLQPDDYLRLIHMPEVNTISMFNYNTYSHTDMKKKLVELIKLSNKKHISRLKI